MHAGVVTTIRSQAEDEIAHCATRPIRRRRADCRLRLERAVRRAYIRSGDSGRTTPVGQRGRAAKGPLSRCTRRLPSVRHRAAPVTLVLDRAGKMARRTLCGIWHWPACPGFRSPVRDAPRHPTTVAPRSRPRLPTTVRFPKEGPGERRPNTPSLAPTSCTYWH